MDTIYIFLDMDIYIFFAKKISLNKACFMTFGVGLTICIRLIVWLMRPITPKGRIRFCPSLAHGIL